jgi:hypothetical protein
MAAIFGPGANLGAKVTVAAVLWLVILGLGSVDPLTRTNTPRRLFTTCRIDNRSQLECNRECE